MVGIQFVLSLGQVEIYTADLRLVYHISTKNKSLQTNVKNQSESPCKIYLICAIMVL